MNAFSDKYQTILPVDIERLQLSDSLPSIKASCSTLSAEKLSSQDDSSNNDYKLLASKESRRRVYFGYLEIREYPITLGDHPECKLGPPISIGWDYDVNGRESVESYESRRKPRRSREELKLGWSTRYRILKRYAKVSDEEIKEAVTKKKLIQKQRLKTKSSLKLWRKISNFKYVLRGKKKRKQYKRKSVSDHRAAFENMEANMGAPESKYFSSQAEF